MYVILVIGFTHVLARTFLPRWVPPITAAASIISGLKSEGSGGREEAKGGEWIWENAGGEFGLSADWVRAVSNSDEESVLTPWCTTPSNQNITQAILQGRREVKQNDAVATCLRTKDYGRYLPEWVAYHWVVGINRIHVYDDDSIDGTEKVCAAKVPIHCRK
ncbi:unnamed protein product [Choristocarpus tenellus]